MSKAALIVAILLIGGIAAGAKWLMPEDPPPLPTVTPAKPVAFNSSAAMEDRVAALETAVTDEREARRVLEDELIALFGELDTLKSNNAPEGAGNGAATSDEPMPVPPRTSPRFRERDSFEQRSEALVKAGFTAERAAYILQRESELRFGQMQAFYEARNSENPDQQLSDMPDPDRTLREEIGDAEYEKYLLANNRSTSVEVEGIMSSSPAATAGLQRGDEIVRYDGERVYNSRDLLERSMDGDGSVVVELVRNGSQMQVVIPRGPIGIEIGRRRGW